MANLLATYGIPRESRIALLLLDTVDFPVAFWGAIKAGVVPVCAQHAADHRAVRLHPRRQPRQGAVRLGAAAARACSRSSGSCRSSSTSSSPAARRRRSRCPFRGELQLPVGRVRGRRHLLRRDRVLALLVGLHRHAEGRAPRALEPDGDGAPARPGLPRHARGRRRLSPPPSCSSPTASATPCRFPMSVGATSRAAARAADARGRVPHPEAAPADHLLRRADALRGDAGLPAGHARERLAAAAPVRLGRRGAAGRGRQGLQAPGSASTSSTASAPPRCCTSTSATAPAT